MKPWLKQQWVIPPDQNADLVKALDDADEDLREAVADTLTRLGEPAVPDRSGPSRTVRPAPGAVPS